MNIGFSRPARLPRLPRLPAGIWVLGFVSMLMDISSEMIHALLPVYLVTVLGASALTVGVIEGIAEATASITKVFSGALSDWLGRRKGLVVLGYGMAAFTKPVFPLAPTVEWLVAARFIDRVGKGIRGAPRDALLADLAPPGLRGASFGLRQALDTVGAVIGPLLAIALLWLMLGASGTGAGTAAMDGAGSAASAATSATKDATNHATNHATNDATNNATISAAAPASAAATADAFRTVFWWAVLPAFLAFALIAFAVREPPRAADTRPVKLPLSRHQLARLPRRYWSVVLLAAVFTLARFSEAFLILRAQDAGLAVTWVPLVLVVMNVVYAMAAYPAGVLADRVDRISLLAFGLVVLIAADLVLAIASGLPAIALGVVLWGLHMALTQGLFAALVADSAPADLRGTAFGVFNLVSGLALLIASVVAGALWDALGPAATFFAGAAFATVTLAGLLFVRWRHRVR